MNKQKTGRFLKELRNEKNSLRRNLPKCWESPTEAFQGGKMV